MRQQELFLERLTERSMQAAASSSGGPSKLSYDDVAAAVEGWDVCDFLKGRCASSRVGCQAGRHAAVA